MVVVGNRELSTVGHRLGYLGSGLRTTPSEPTRQRLVDRLCRKLPAITESDDPTS
ncbi:MAG: hypothetical protein QOG20_2512 [Pseudonocardiales bacterium]|jgi:hypothetical protein|nr:hypothetical protein [Pseudonocardiales bacterium]